MSEDKTLPLRVRQGIRDDAENPESRLARKLAVVSKILGHQIVFEPEWRLLWTALGTFTSDQATFIPSISSVVIAFCDAFTEWIDRTESAKQVDQLLDDLSSKRGMRIALEVTTSSSISDAHPTARWEPTQGAFALSLPKAALPTQSIAMSAFTTDLLALFTAPPTQMHRNQPQVTNSPVEEDRQSISVDEGWDTLTDKTPLTPATDVVSKSMRLGSSFVSPDYLPDITTIERPEELTKRPPYLLTVRQEGRARVVVQGSHHQSLVLLQSYLKRWVRSRLDHVDKWPVAKFTLQSSTFGLGLLYDTLLIEAEPSAPSVSAMLILVFVENVLCYEPVTASADRVEFWQFRRTRGFR